MDSEQSFLLATSNQAAKTWTVDAPVVSLLHTSLWDAWNTDQGHY